MLPRNLSHVVGLAQTHQLYSFEFKERGLSIWTFLRTWHKRWTCSPQISNCFASDATSDFSVLASVVAAVSGSTTFVAVSGGSHVLADTHGDYLGSRYDCKHDDFSTLDLRLLKRCLQKVSSGVLVTLDSFCMAEFVVTRLKVAEHRDWTMSRSSPRRVIITGELLLPSLLEVASNIVGVRLVIILYIKETGKKDRWWQLSGIMHSIFIPIVLGP